MRHQEEDMGLGVHFNDQWCKPKHYFSMKGHQEYKNVSVVNATLKPEEMKIMKKPQVLRHERNREKNVL